MIGIDEVGRGAWAGPLLVVAARKRVELPSGLKDSKKLTKKQRESLVGVIATSCDLGEGWVNAQEVDALGLTDGMKLAVSRALQAIEAQTDEEIIMDGHINYCSDIYGNVNCVIKADNVYPIVSAASIYAKVLRDNYMIKQALLYPEYNFEANVGYGTAKHSIALKLFGVTKLHRVSYKPIKAIHDKC